MGNDSSGPDRSADLPAGYDEDDPYEGEDIETYPQWWRENVEEFQEHNMRPYRPPRFRDGTIVPEFVNELQERFGVDIKFQNRNPKTKDDDPHQTRDWDLLVDGESTSTVPRYRAPEGYSVYDIESTTLEEMVQNYMH